MRKNISLSQVFLIMILCLYSFIAPAQELLVKGTVSSYAGDSLQVFLLHDAENYQEEAVFVPIKDGAFVFKFSSPVPRFISLPILGPDRRFILSKGRPLELRINAADSSVVLSGNGAAENRIAALSGYDREFWRKYNGEADAIGSWSADSLLTVLLRQIHSHRDSIMKLFETIVAPSLVKQCLLTETKYQYAAETLKFSMWITRGYRADAPWKRLTDAVIQATPLPTAENVINLPSANSFMYELGKKRFMYLAVDFMSDSINGKSKFEKGMGFSFDSATTLARIYGEDYIMTRLAAKIFPVHAVKSILTNRIHYNYKENELATVQQYVGDWKRSFPNEEIPITISGPLAELQNRYQANTANTQIVFLPDQPVNSLAELVKPFRGKVVYLDIWGTWCGPCRDEMKHVPAMKKALENKDVVFLYIDMDPDEKEKQWRDYVYINSLTGQHLRMTQDELEILWKELLPADVHSRFYPSYYIFDKDGNRVKEEAYRPSSGVAVVEQLEKMVN